MSPLRKGEIQARPTGGLLRLPEKGYTSLMFLAVSS